MLAYIIRRLALIIPTLFGIMVLNFFIIQLAPGGPVEQMIAQISGTAVDATARIGGADRAKLRHKTVNLPPVPAVSASIVGRRG